MEPNIWPPDPVSASALLERVVDEIDARTDAEQMTLLSDFLCAAWGSVRGQNQ
jgi:hypothetical protein